MSDEILLNSPEGKEAIRQAVEEATQGLLKKRDELLGELKKARKNSEISPDDYAKLKEENEELNDQIREIKKEHAVYVKEAEKTKKAYDEEVNQSTAYMIDNGLNDAINECKIRPELAKAVKAMFASQAAVTKDGLSRKAMIGDKSLKEALTLWAATDEGKHFVAPPSNSGGGSTGGKGGTGDGKSISWSQFESMSHEDRSVFFKAGGTVIDG